MVFRICLPKEMSLAESVTGATPDPLRLAICGLLPALSVTTRLPVSPPRAAGVKVTLIVQLAPTPSVFGVIGQFDV